MNIFALSADPADCARYHCDRHVVKMCCEYGQIVSTVLHWRGLIVPGQYKPIKGNLTPIKWADSSWGNFRWLLDLWGELLQEYTYRYGKVYKSAALYKEVRKWTLYTLWPPDRREMTPFSLSMPPELMTYSSDPVECYREYYRRDKARFARWTGRGVPEWFRVEAIPAE